MRTVSRHRLAVIIGTCFFLSGLTGLAYQVLWVHTLSLVFGATNLAISTVLTAFMGGLALGSFLGGRYADRLRRPLLGYGVLQVVIGVYALLVPVMFGGLTPVYQLVWAKFHPSFWGFSLMRFGIAAIVLIVPTTAMGATLPMISRFFARRREDVGFNIGRIYGLNTLGAVFGVLAPVFVLIPAMGVRTSVTLMAVVSLGIGVLSVASGWGEVTEAALRPAPKRRAEASVSGGPRGDWRTTVALAAFGVSGFVGMAYEIAYTRYIASVAGSTAYAFTIVLATFLVGLALGSLVGSYVSRRSRNELFLIGAVQLFVGISVYAGAWVFKEVPYIFFVLAHPGVGTRHLTTVPLLAVCAMVTFLPALFMGAMFPLVVKFCTRDVRSVGRSVGVAAAVNTIGSIIGAFAGGFLLLPVLGLMGTFVAGMSVNLVLAIVLSAASQAQGLFRGVAVGAAALALANVVAFRPAWGPEMMTGGRYSTVYVEAEVGREQFVRSTRPLRGQVLAHGDGIEVATTVLETLDGHRILLSNGRSEGSTRSDMPTHVLLAGVPLALAPKTDDVLVVGFATGTTVGSALKFPKTHVVAAELEPKMVEFSKFFKPLNGNPLEQLGKRLTIELNDARNLLLVDPRRYDVIISEPSDIYVSGITNLFSKNFYALAKSRLKPDGVFCQWLQSYGVTADLLRTVLRTFSQSFRWVYVFQIETGDYLFLGSDAEEPLWVDAGQLARRVSVEPVRQDLARVGVNGPADIIATFLLGPAEVEHFVSEGSQIVNTDDNLYLELEAPRSYWAVEEHIQPRDLRRLAPDEYPHLIYPGGEEQHADWLMKFAEWRLQDPDYGSAAPAAERAVSLGAGTEARLLLAEAYLREDDPEAARAQWDSILKNDPNHIPTLLTYAEYSAVVGELDQVLHYARRALEVEADNALARFYAGWALYQQGLKAEASKDLEIAALDKEVEEAHPETLSMLAFCEAAAEPPRYESAARHLGEYLELRPRDAGATYFLGAYKYYLGEIDEAIGLWQKASVLAEQEAWYVRENARALASAGEGPKAVAAYMEAARLFSVDKNTYGELTQLLWRMGNVDAVISVLETMLEAFPGESNAYMQIAKAHEWKGEAGKAVENYEQAARLEKHPAVRAKIEAAIEELRRRAPAGETEAGAAVESGGPTTGTAAREGVWGGSESARELLRLAALELQKGNVEMAASKAREALEEDPSNTLARYYTGIELLAQGKIDEAIADLGETVSDEAAVSEVPEALHHLALCYADPQMGQYEKAIPLLRRYVDVSGRISSAHYHLGGAEYLTGEEVSAVRNWQKGYVASVSQSVFLLSRGREALAARDVASARRLLEDSLRVMPYNRDALLELASLRYVRREPTGAVELLERALELYPTDKRIYHLTALVDESTGDVEAAILNYKRYVRLEEDLAMAREIDNKLQELRKKLPEQGLKIRPIWEGIAGAAQDSTAEAADREPVIR